MLIISACGSVHHYATQVNSAICHEAFLDLGAQWTEGKSVQAERYC